MWRGSAPTRSRLTGLEDCKSKTSSLQLIVGEELPVASLGLRIREGQIVRDSFDDLTAGTFSKASHVSESTLSSLFLFLVGGKPPLVGSEEPSRLLGWV